MLNRILVGIFTFSLCPHNMTQTLRVEYAQLEQYIGINEDWLMRSHGGGGGSCGQVEHFIYLFIYCGQCCDLWCI